MKTLIAIAMLVAWAGAPALAQDKPARTTIRARDVPLYDVYAWERWGNFINAPAGGKTEIPYDAARLQVKVYTYPAGEIRAIRFNNAVRTHRHINQTDTILYSWQAHRVQFVNDLAVLAGPGDFAFHQKGVDHSGEEIRRGGGIDLEFVWFNPGRHNDPTGFWSLAKDHPVEDAASWRDGRLIREVVGDTAAAPAHAARYRVRRATFPGMAAREIHLPAGTILPTRSDTSERLFFVLSGRIGVTGGAYELGSEDSAYAGRGKDFAITALTDSMIVEASLPPLAVK
jgi:hypothetical protein